MADGDPAFTIRPADREDLAEILRIYNHYVERSPATFEVVPVQAEDRRGWLDEHTGGGRYRLLVATDSRAEVVGWATSSRFRPRAAYDTSVESSVYCRHGFQGRGIGTALYRALFQLLRSEDIERFVAGITLPNPASIRLHRGFGFRPVGTFHRIGRKFGRYWDVEWYERSARETLGPDAA